MQHTPTKTRATAPNSPVALIEDASLAAWSLFGAAIGGVLGILLLRVFSIGI